MKMTNRLMIYDATTLKDGLDWKEDSLAYSWLAGGRLYRIVNFLEKSKGVTSWSEGLDYLIEEGKKKKISQVQFWGHGLWGRAYIGGDKLSTSRLKNDKELAEKFKELSALMTEDAFWWFRTCQTYATESGHEFAKSFTNLIDRKTAAHTHTIGLWQSGGRTLMPGEEPSWSTKQGVENGEAELSSRTAVNSIPCLQGRLPKSW